MRFGQLEESWVETNQVAETKPKMSRFCNIWFGEDEWEGILLTLTVPPHVSVISHFSCHGLTS